MNRPLSRPAAVALLVIALALAAVGPLVQRAGAAPEQRPHSVASERIGRTTPLPKVPLQRHRGLLTAPASAAAGARIHVRATFRPVRPGRPVALMVKTAAGWRTIKRSVMSARGVASFRHAPAATTTYRAVAIRWRGAKAIRTAPRTVVVAGPAPGARPWVTGYYAGWFWDQMYRPERVDMTAMTHFVFGRSAPGGGSLGGRPGEVVDGAGTAQEQGTAPDDSGRSVEDYLVRRAHAAGTKALLMLGGDGYDGRGFVLSSADAVRPMFVENVVDHLVAHDYDGVDLDWENCLMDEADCGEADGADPIPGAEKQRRLMALIDDLRAEMATRERYAATPGLITFPGYPLKINENGGRPAPWQVDVAQRVDQYNLMSYGVGTTWNGGGWDSWFSGALHGAGGSHPVDIASSIRAYAAAGVARGRLGIGIGFYGIYYGPDIDRPRQSTDGNEIYEVQDVALSYASLDELGYLDHGTRRWDRRAKSTYRVYGGAGFVPAGDPGRTPAGLLSYEDPRSIAAKGDWVRRTGVGGTILWTINYGWVPASESNPLLAAVKRSFLRQR
jgi:GH18 family chitinase